MVSIIISWLISYFVFISFGNILLNIYNIFNKEHQSYGLTDKFFLGICFTGSLLAFFSIWFPINGITTATLLLISVLYNIYIYTVRKENIFAENFKIFKSFSTGAKITGLLLILILLIHSLLPPIAFDSYLYHVQAIMWTEQYPVIPGLGNIHGRFGFNSNSLLLSSAFNFKDLFGFRTYGLISVSTIAFYLWLIKNIFTSNSFWIKTGLIIFGFLFLYTFRGSFSSPATDPLPHIIVAYVLFKSVLESESYKKSPLTFWVLPIFALTLKLSVIPICLLSALILFELFKEQNHRNVCFLLCLSLFLIIPWCIRNIYITGYVVYPYPGIDLFNFDWKIPTHLVETEKGLVTSWAKIPRVSLEEFHAMSFSEWFNPWLLRHITYSPILCLIYFLAVISPLFVIGLTITKKIKSGLTIFPWIIAFMGSVFWFIMAPDIRFGFAFVALAGILPIMMIDIKINNKQAVNILYGTFIASIIYVGILSVHFFRGNVGGKPYYSFLYSPQSFISLKNRYKTEYIPHAVGNTTIYNSVNGYCFDDCFPCTVSYENELEMRGRDIKDGFRIKHKTN